MPIVNFHLPADDVDRAARFYQEVFGWTFVPFPDSPAPYLVHDSPQGAGIPAAIVRRDGFLTAPAPTIDVEDIDAAMASIATSGGQQGQVTVIPGIGRFGYAIDSERNVIALLQRDSVAL